MATGKAKDEGGSMEDEKGDNMVLSNPAAPSLGSHARYAGRGLR